MQALLIRIIVRLIMALVFDRWEAFWQPKKTNLKADCVVSSWRVVAGRFPISRRFTVDIGI